MLSLPQGTQATPWGAESGAVVARLYAPVCDCVLMHTCGCCDCLCVLHMWLYVCMWFCVCLCNMHAWLCGCVWLCMCVVYCMWL